MLLAVRWLKALKINSVSFLNPTLTAKWKRNRKWLANWKRISSFCDDCLPYSDTHTVRRAYLSASDSAEVLSVCSLRICSNSFHFIVTDCLLSATHNVCSSVCASTISPQTHTTFYPQCSALRWHCRYPNVDCAVPMIYPEGYSEWGADFRHSSGVCYLSTVLTSLAAVHTHRHKHTHAHIQRDKHTLNKPYIFGDCVLERDFFYPTALQSRSLSLSLSLSLSAHTHTHRESIFFHPLIPNCLRKRRVEIPLQCLGSAMFGNRSLSHIVVGGRRTAFLKTPRTFSPLNMIYSLTDVEVVLSKSCACIWLLCEVE